MIAAEMRGNKPSLDDALGWIGSRVDDILGAGIGRLEDIWIDPGTGAPRWLLVKEGRFGGRTTLIPIEDATVGAGRIWVPYAREIVGAAPEVEPRTPLTQQLEMSLRQHYAANAAVAHAQPTAATVGPEAAQAPWQEAPRAQAPAPYAAPPPPFPEAQPAPAPQAVPPPFPDLAPQPQRLIIRGSAGALLPPDAPQWGGYGARPYDAQIGRPPPVTPVYQAPPVPPPQQHHHAEAYPAHLRQVHEGYPGQPAAPSYQPRASEPPPEAPFPAPGESRQIEIEIVGEIRISGDIRNVRTVAPTEPDAFDR